VLIAGIDEAGRGCVVGPLVVAGVCIKEENLPALTQLGVKDSKLLTAKKRQKLFPMILSLAEKYLVLKVPPHEIDYAVKSQRKLFKLNRLEAQTMGKIVEELKPNTVYVDSADVIEKRFAQHILEASSFKTKIISEHKADQTYPIVSAASIIAKVERDSDVEKLRTKYGDFGTGYLTDPKTAVFLNQWLKTHTEYPDMIRKSWKPAKLAKDHQGTTQQKLA
jgi:ribonuclease HII